MTVVAGGGKLVSYIAKLAKFKSADTLTGFLARYDLLSARARVGSV